MDEDSDEIKDILEGVEDDEDMNKIEKDHETERKLN